VRPAQKGGRADDSSAARRPSTRTRYLESPSLLAVAAVLVLTAACGGKSDFTQSTDPLVIDVSYVNHVLNTGGQSVYKVAKGKDIRLVVYSTTDDVVHIQGYNKTVTAPARQLVQVEFIANKTGHFNVELQRSHVRALQVQVS
jgi:hypothetical protein